MSAGVDFLAGVTPKDKGSGLSKFLAWCAIVEQTDEGRVALSNMYHDCVHDRLPRTVRRRFYDELSTIIDETETNPDRQLRMMKDLLDRLVDDFACSASEPVQPSGRCSHFVPDLWLFSSNTDSLRRGWAIHDTVSIVHLRELEAGRARWGAIPPGRFQRAWVTRMSEVDGIRTLPNCAELLREKLGLLHFFELDDLYLVEIQYPADLFDGGGLFPPMFLDGSTVVVYRSKIGSDKWGRAVELDARKSYGDGFAEAVHRKVTFTVAFDVKPIDVMHLMEHDPDSSVLHGKTPDPWRSGMGPRLEGLLK